MPFGPYVLKNVVTENDNLVLELADDSGRVKYRPKRKLSYRNSHEARITAERLVGSLVTTDTYDPSRWPTTDWWVNISPYERPTERLAGPVSKVFGPPGTGKTSRLIEHVKQHVRQGGETSKIGFFTFTNGAADVARQRVLEAFPEKTAADFPNFSTLHSLATRIGGLMGRQILDVGRLREFDPNIRSESVWMKKGDPSSVEERPDYLPLAIQSFARARCISVEDAIAQGEFADLDSSELTQSLRSFLEGLTGWFVEEAGVALIKRYLEEYGRFKDRHRLADFDDVIDNAQKETFPHGLPEFDLLIVDEAQDLSELQWRLVRRLMAKARRTIVAGDDDQAIMVPFGASPTAFLALAGESEVLQASRRVPKAVHEYVIANSLAQIMRRHPDRKGKSWQPRDEPGRVETHVVKLVRERPASKPGVMEKVPLNLPDLLRQVAETRDEQWLIMAPTKASCQRISKGLTELGVPHYLRNKPILDPERTAADIRIMSIHTSKGDEADNAALVLVSDADESMIENDPRLAYVAHTRARNVLYPVVRPSR